MFKTLQNALKVKEIRTKLIYTFFAMIIVRIGCLIPIPGVNTQYISQWFEEQKALDFFQ